MNVVKGALRLALTTTLAAGAFVLHDSPAAASNGPGWSRNLSRDMMIDAVVGGGQLMTNPLLNNVWTFIDSTYGQFPTSSPAGSCYWGTSPVTCWEDPAQGYRVSGLVGVPTGPGIADGVRWYVSDQWGGSLAVNPNPINNNNYGMLVGAGDTDLFYFTSTVAAGDYIDFGVDPGATTSTTRPSSTSSSSASEKTGSSMNTSRITASSSALFAVGSATLVAAAAGAPSEGVWPLGEAVIGPILDQRFEVSNIGDSGEDGVEIGAGSRFDRGLAIDLDAVLGTPDATFHIEHGGEDGLVHGSVDIFGHGDGAGTLVFDYSGLGATEIHVVEYDGFGAVVSDETLADPILESPNVPNLTCPDGSEPTVKWMQVWRSGRWYLVWVCRDTEFFTHERVIVVSPVLPGGASEPGTAERVTITASGIPSLTIAEADIAGLDI
jgi:hypothetical protein